MEPEGYDCDEVSSSMQLYAQAKLCKYLKM